MRTKSKKVAKVICVVLIWSHDKSAKDVSQNAIRTKGVSQNAIIMLDGGTPFMMFIGFLKSKVHNYTMLRLT